MRFDRRELAGAVADLGVFVPIAVALIVSNGLSPTAVLMPAGLLYIVNALFYGLPLPAQPLKAFGAIAIAKGLGSDEIAAGALLLGVLFLVAGRLGLVDRAARAFPRPLVRGVQLTVGLIFLKIAWGLVANPPKAFAEHALPPVWAIALAVAAAVVVVVFRGAGAALVLVLGGAAVMLATANGGISLGPSELALPSLDGAVLFAALTALVVPQAPLSFANSCLATSDGSRAYFGEERSRRVRPGSLATTFGLANVFAGSIAGMPVCHGAGGLTAHVSFGARTGGAPLVMGLSLVTIALAAGASLATLLVAFPLPILAALLATAGVLHIGLLRDLSGGRAWALALLVGVFGFTVDLPFALGVGLALWWVPVAVGRVRTRFA